MNKKKKSLIIISASMAVIIIFTVALNVLSLTKFDNIFEKFFGSNPPSVRGETLGADVEYYKSDFGSAGELYEYEEKKVVEIAEEGITILENNGILPLEMGTKLSIFSHSSVDLVSGGSGSGSSGSGSGSSGSGSSGSGSTYYEFIGNSNTKKFHLPTCSYLPDPANRDYLYDYYFIINVLGYTPCQICLKNYTP